MRPGWPGTIEEASSDALGTPAILALCDRAIGEVGRRKHVFTWLRAPGSMAGEWLAVDAYYPGHRLVVLVRDQPWRAATCTGSWCRRTGCACSS